MAALANPVTLGSGRALARRRWRREAGAWSRADPICPRDPRGSPTGRDSECGMIVDVDTFIHNRDDRDDRDVHEALGWESSKPFVG